MRIDLTDPFDTVDLILLSLPAVESIFVLNDHKQLLIKVYVFFGTAASDVKFREATLNFTFMIRHDFVSHVVNGSHLV